MKDEYADSMVFTNSVLFATQAWRVRSRWPIVARGGGGRKGGAAAMLIEGNETGIRRVYGDFFTTKRT